jgi:hypothetical protein
MSDDTTFGEIWLRILTNSFPSMSEEQAVSLLAKQGGLAKALASGSSNGRGTEITAWLNGVLKERNNIGSAISRDPRKQPAVYSCMNPLFACLFSSESNILSLAARVILALAQVIPPENTYEVITTAIDPDEPRSPNAMLLGILVVMEKATSKPTRTKMCRFLTTICDMSSKRLRDLVRTHLTNAARSTACGPALLHDVVIGMAEIDQNLKDVLCLDLIVDQITNECLSLLETMVDAPESRDRDSTSFSPRREALISQMLSLGALYQMFGAIAPGFLDGKVQKRMLRVLGRGTRHSVLSIQMASTTVLFNLFEMVGADSEGDGVGRDSGSSGGGGASLGPQVYKALIFLLVESHADAKRGSGFDGVLREYVANSMSSSIEKLPRVPIDVLVEPLLAQIQLVGCQVYDFGLLESIIAHPRLSPKCASLIANALGRYALGHPVFWRISDRLLSRLVRKFQDQVADSIVTIVKGAVRLFPPASSRGSREASQTKAAEAQRWLCVCCLRAIVEVSETSLRKQLLEPFDEIEREKRGEDVDTIVSMLSEPASKQNLPQLNGSGAPTDTFLPPKIPKNDRMELTSAGSDSGNIKSASKSSGCEGMGGSSGSGGSGSGRRNTNNDGGNNSGDNSGGSHGRRRGGENSSSRAEEVSPRTTPTSRYRGEKVIKASSMDELRRENSNARRNSNNSGGSNNRTSSPRSDNSGRSGGKGLPAASSPRSDRKTARNRNGGRARPSPRSTKARAAKNKSVNNFVKTTLGQSVNDDIQRIRAQVEEKKRIQDEKEEEQKRKSAKIREAMRKKFAHIKG